MRPLEYGDNNSVAPDLMQTAFLWPVATCGYHWVDSARCADTDNPAGPVLVACNAQAPRKLSKPLEDTTLFLDFAALKATAASVAAFANRHGPLTAAKVVLVPSVDGEWKLCGTDSLSTWASEIHAMARAVDLWENILNKQAGLLRKFIIWAPDSSAVEYVYRDEHASICHLLASAKHKTDLFARFVPGDVLGPARHELQTLINKKMSKYPSVPRLVWSKKDKLTGYLVPSSLLAALWLQLYLAASGAAAFKRCDLCGVWEDAGKHSPRWRRHETCANRHRVDNHRKKKKALRLLDAGLTADEIATKLVLDASQILKWTEGGKE